MWGRRECFRCEQMFLSKQPLMEQFAIGLVRTNTSRGNKQSLKFQFQLNWRVLITANMVNSAWSLPFMESQVRFYAFKRKVWFVHKNANVFASCDLLFMLITMIQWKCVLLCFITLYLNLGALVSSKKTKKFRSTHVSYDYLYSFKKT